MALPDEQVRLQVEQDDAIAQALGAPERVAILRALVNAAEPLSLNTLAVSIGLDATTIAAHLSALGDVGAVSRSGDADDTYRLASTPLARMILGMLASPSAEDADPRSNRGILEALLDQLPNGVAFYDTSGVLIRVNPAGERITRRPPIPGETQEIRLSRYEMRRPDGTPMPLDESPSGRALQGEVVSRMECIIDGQHGRDTWLRCSSAPLRDERGAIQGAVVIYDDITDERLLTGEEAHQRALAAAMIEHTFSSMAVFDVSDAFRCVRHNDNFLHLMDSRFEARGSVVGVPLDELFEGDSLAQVREIYERVRATGEPYVNYEFSVEVPPESRRWFRIRLTPVRDESGTIIGLLMVVFEITELVTARETSRRHANELSAIIEAMPEAVMLAERNGHVVLSNSAAMRILGHVVTDFPARDSGATFHSYSSEGRRLDPKDLPLNRALQGETVVSQELVYQRNDGTRIDLLTSAAPVDLDDTGQITAAVAIFQDISRIKELERQRDDFLGIAAHELRTPLATVLATLQAFLRRIQKNPGEQAIAPDALVSGLERMYRQSQRLNKLVSDLLDATRIRTGKLIYELEPCDLVQVVSDAVAGQVAANPDRAITLTLPDESVMVMGDGFRLSQVVDNLVSNALKYSQADMPVTVSLKVEGQRAKLRVADKGVGIPPENIKQLFTRFYRVPGIDVQSGAGVGLGLGLHITGSVIERHGGRIKVRSTPGKGSTFLVSLPLLEDTGQPET